MAEEAAASKLKPKITDGAQGAVGPVEINRAGVRRRGGWWLGSA